MRQINPREHEGPIEPYHVLKKDIIETNKLVTYLPALLTHLQISFIESADGGSLLVNCDACNNAKSIEIKTASKRWACKCSVHKMYMADNLLGFLMMRADYQKSPLTHREAINLVQEFTGKPHVLTAAEKRALKRRETAMGVYHVN